MSSVKITNRKQGFFRRPSCEREWDVVTVVFLRMMCADPQLDYDLSHLLMLFAVDMPKTSGGYAHHGH